MKYKIMSSCVDGFVDQDDSRKKYSVWYIYGILSILLVWYGMMAKPGEKVLGRLWLGYALVAALIGVSGIREI